MSELVNVTGADFASELLLNKMMNGQVATSDGTTVTAGLRAQASSLYRDALEPSVASANVSAAIPDVSEIQTMLTEAKSYIDTLYENIGTGSYETISSTITEGMNWLESFLTSTYGDGSYLYGESVSEGVVTTASTDDSTQSIDLGLGSSMTIGGIDLSMVETLYKALYDIDAAGSSADGDPSSLLSALQSSTDTTFEDATNELINGMGVTSAQIETLQNRSLMLEDVASTYTTAGNEQYLTGTGGASGLLSSMIG